VREYFKRLKTHPGLGIASIMTFVGALAGGMNPSFQVVDGLIFGGLVMGGFCWGAVLISNFRKD